MKKVNKLDVKEFEERIKDFLYSFEIPYKNIDNYILAFIHRSVLNENISDFTESNERLEFLGDAVLELTITELLFLKYPEKPEGDLTDLRSAIVKGNSLAEVSEDFGFGDYIILSKGEIMAQGNKNGYILANTLEAFLGALYLDLGYDFSKDFIGKHIFSVIDKILDNDLHIDPKSYLQEFTQNKYLITPTYEVLMESGQDHSKEYVIGVYVGDKKVGEGVGPSKKKAQKNAAINALENKNKLSNLFD